MLCILTRRITKLWRARFCLLESASEPNPKIHHFTDTQSPNYTIKIGYIKIKCLMSATYIECTTVHKIGNDLKIKPLLCFFPSHRLCLEWRRQRYRLKKKIKIKNRPPRNIDKSGVHSSDLSLVDLKQLPDVTFTSIYLFI